MPPHSDASHPIDARLAATLCARARAAGAPVAYLPTGTLLRERAAAWLAQQQLAADELARWRRWIGALDGAVIEIALAPHVAVAHVVLTASDVEHVLAEIDDAAEQRRAPRRRRVVCDEAGDHDHIPEEDP